jgi:hypothetical protein
MAKIQIPIDNDDNLFDPWEHMEEDDISFKKMKPKVKKVKKEKEYTPDKKKSFNRD